MAVSSNGMMLARLDDAVEDAVEGRWLLYFAICASDRAVFVKPEALLAIARVNLADDC